MATSKIKSDSVDTLAGTKLTGIVTAKGDGSSADGKITLNCSQNSHGVSIQSPPHSAAASYTLTLPVNDGNNDEALKTNGSGVLSWGQAGGPSLGTNAIIRTNGKTISENITVGPTTNNDAKFANGMSAGPITIANGFTVTIEAGGAWSVV